MNYLVLLGIVIVVVGFALKLDSILIVIVAGLATALIGGLGIDGFLVALGTSFVDNRNMAIFIIILLVTGTLERNGLKTAATNLIGKVKNATPGVIIALYGVMRMIFAAFNVSFGGVAGFVRPVIMPMCVGAVQASGHTPNDEYIEQVKAMASGMENVAWFFGQVLFVGTSGALLVQSTMDALGYQTDLLQMALFEIPVALVALAVTSVYYIILDNKLRAKYYGSASASKNAGKEA